MKRLQSRVQSQGKFGSPTEGVRPRTISMHPKSGKASNPVGIGVIEGFERDLKA